MSSNLSSFAVDAAGNLYVSDYNNIYVLDAEGNVQFKLDGSQYNGSLCRLNAQQVGVMWYNYTDDVNAADENGHTSSPGVFAAGDIVTGPKTVVEAVAFAKKVALEIDRYCREN